MKKTFIFAALFTILSGASAWAVHLNTEGTINITVVDENGTIVPDAPLYIYGENKTHFVGGREISGSTMLSMPAGTYKISSAIVKKTGDYLDRFASHEAHIEVIPGDNTSIVLTLRAINEDGMEGLGVAELSKIGITTDASGSIN